MEKHYTEFDCDYCKFYPCSRFSGLKPPGKVIRYNCGDFEEDPEEIKKLEKENE